MSDIATVTAEAPLGVAITSPESIDTLEARMVEGFPEIEIPVSHGFGDGCYIRACRIPAGTLLTSLIHRGPHVVVMTEGDLTVWSDDGSRVRLLAPCTFMSGAGRRVGLAHADTTWMTVHQTEETDVRKIELALYDRRINPLLGVDYGEIGARA